jgi:hypothetical protein
MCSNGFFHFLPHTVPVMIDQDGVVLPRDGVHTGRLGLFDLLAESYWGGFMSGDRVTMYWDYECGCGWNGPRVDRDIARFAELEGGDDDKITSDFSRGARPVGAYLAVRSLIRQPGEEIDEGASLFFVEYGEVLILGLDAAVHAEFGDPQAFGREVGANDPAMVRVGLPLYQPPSIQCGECQLGRLRRDQQPPRQLGSRKPGLVQQVVERPHLGGGDVVDADRLADGPMAVLPGSLQQPERIFGRYATIGGRGGGRRSGARGHGRGTIPPRRSPAGSETKVGATTWGRWRDRCVSA